MREREGLAVIPLFFHSTFSIFKRNLLSQVMKKGNLVVSLNTRKLVSSYCTELPSVLFAGMLRKLSLICRHTVNVNCGFSFNPVK